MKIHGSSLHENKLKMSYHVRNARMKYDQNSCYVLEYSEYTIASYVRPVARIFIITVMSTRCFD
jgi:hypothetical protein